MLGTVALAVVALGMPLGADPAAPAATSCQGRPATLVAEAGTPLLGTNRADVMVGTSGADSIDGRGGADVICGLGGDDTLTGGRGKDVCLGGTGATSFTGCEQVGAKKLARTTAFPGTWDAEYSNPTVWNLVTPCADDTPELASQGFYMFVVMCDSSAYIGTFTPIIMSCYEGDCFYPLGTDARAISEIRRGAFEWVVVGGYPLSELICWKRARFANDITVTKIDRAGRIAEFTWRTGGGDCREVYGERSGWHTFTDVRVFRVADPPG